LIFVFCKEFGTESVVKKISPSLGAPDNSASTRPDQRTRIDNGLRDDAAPSTVAARMINNPYAKKRPVQSESAVIRALPAANAPATGPIVNPYAKRPAPQQLDATKMLMDSKYREFHRRPVSSSKPPIPYPQSKTAKMPDPGEQYRQAGNADPKLTLRTSLKDAYFKIDDYNYVTISKHQELLKAKNSKIRPPKNIAAHNYVLLSDPTKTMLVSPQKLAALGEKFAAKKLQELNIDRGSSIVNQPAKNRHEILILSPKNDQIFSLQNLTKNRTFKPHQIFIAVDDVHGRLYADLRVLIADKTIPPLSKEAETRLKQIVEPETHKLLSGLMANQPAVSSKAKRSGAAPGSYLPSDEPSLVPSPAKKIRPELNDRSRDKDAGLSL
jgi:hypothetical protein